MILAFLAIAQGALAQKNKRPEAVDMDSPTFVPTVKVGKVFEGGDSIGDFNKNLKPTYSAFADVKMEHEFIQHRVDNVLDNQFVEVVCSEVLELVESYDPTQTDDGNSPLQEYDWGLAVAFMRGGGANMTIQHYDYNFDGFTNSKWKTTAGDYQMSSDSMTVDGEDYDYNGIYDGDGGGDPGTFTNKGLWDEE